MNTRILILIACIALTGCGGAQSPLGEQTFVGTWILEKESIQKLFKAPPPEGSATITLKANNLCDLAHFPNIVASKSMDQLSPENVFSGEGTWKFISADACIEVGFKQDGRNYFLRFPASENELRIQLGDPDDMKNLVYRRIQSAR